MFMNIITTILSIITFAMCCNNLSAKADEFTPFIQSACVPEGNIISIYLSGSWNMDAFKYVESSPPNVLRAQTLHDWNNSPIKCNILGHELVAKSINYHGRTIKGTCSSFETSGIEVAIDSKIYLRDPALYGQCDTSSEMSVQFSGVFLRICKTTFPSQTPWDISGVPTTPETYCKIIPLNVD